MFTPQQLEQISFDKAVFGGYDMESVDQILEPLLEDYVTLYKENATLKSKMRVVVEKLEEYRRNEGTVKEALRSAQRTCDAMVREAEAKCIRMMNQSRAGGTVAPAVDTARLEEAKAGTLEGIAALEEQMKALQESLDSLKAKTEAIEIPQAPAAPEPSVAPPAESQYDVAKEIAENLERLVGTTEDTAPVAPRPSRIEGATNRFTNMDLQFGKNYDPTRR